MSNVLPFPSNPAPDEPDAERHAETERGLNDVVGAVLRDERTQQGRTLAEVAEKSAVSLPYLSEVERGRKDASAAVITAICNALELSLPDLLERSADQLRIDARSQRPSGFMALAA